MPLFPLVLQTTTYFKNHFITTNTSKYWFRFVGVLEFQSNLGLFVFTVYYARTRGRGWRGASLDQVTALRKRICQEDGVIKQEICQWARLNRVYYHREDNRRWADRNVGECTWLVVSSDASQQSGAHRRMLPVCALWAEACVVWGWCSEAYRVGFGGGKTEKVVQAGNSVTPRLLALYLGPRRPTEITFHSTLSSCSC